MANRSSSPTWGLLLSHMFSAPNDLPAHLRPIDTSIQLLIHQPTNYHIVTPDHIHAMRLLDRRLLVVLWSDHTLDCIFKHKVGDLIAAEESAGKRAAVDCEDQDFFCAREQGLLAVAGEGL